MLSWIWWVASQGFLSSLLSCWGFTPLALFITRQWFLLCSMPVKVGCQLCHSEVHRLHHGYCWGLASILPLKVSWHSTRSTVLKIFFSTLIVFDTEERMKWQVKSEQLHTLYLKYRRRRRNVFHQTLTRYFHNNFYLFREIY